jgi:hypothetical protein
MELGRRQRAAFGGEGCCVAAFARRAKDTGACKTPNGDAICALQHISRAAGRRRRMHYPPDLSLASSYIPACLCVVKCTAAFVLFIFSPVRGWIGLISLLLTDRILWNRHPAHGHYYYFYQNSPSSYASTTTTILDVNAVCVALVGGLMVMHARADGVKTLVHLAVIGAWALLSSLQVLGFTRLHRAYEVLFGAFAVSVLSCLHQAQERTELLALRSFAFVVANTALPYLGVMLQQPDIDTYVNVCRTLLILLGKPEVAGAWVVVYILCIGYQVRRIGAAGAQGAAATQQAAQGGSATRRTGAGGGGKGRESSSPYQYPNGVQHQNPCFYYPPHHPSSSSDQGLGLDDCCDGEMGNISGRQHSSTSGASYPHQTPSSFREGLGGLQQQQGDASSSSLACSSIMSMANAQSQLRLLAPSSSSSLGGIQLQQLKAATSASGAGDLHHSSNHHAGGGAASQSPEEEAALLREALANRKGGAAGAGGFGGRDV